MKIKGFIITGIILVILGVGATAVASTQMDFQESFTGVFSDPNLEKKEETFGEIKKIIYDGTDENIDIVYSEGENTLTYYESESLTYEISYNEELKELKIEQNHSITFFNFYTSKKAVLTINSSLDEVQMDVSAGNIEIRDLTIGIGKIEVNAGNIKLENTTFSSLILKSDAGNVNATNLTADSGSFDIKAGNLKLVDSKLVTSTIVSNAGNVTLTNTTFDVVDARLNAGNFTFSGDVLIRGEFKLDAGNLKLMLARPQASYQVNGEGSGDTIIQYKVSAGNKKITFTE